jgi:hypothetical protein
MRRNLASRATSASQSGGTLLILHAARDAKALLLRSELKSNSCGFRAVNLPPRALTCVLRRRSRASVCLASRCAAIDNRVISPPRARALALDDANAGPAADLALKAEVPGSSKVYVKKTGRPTSTTSVAQRPRTRRTSSSACAAKPRPRVQQQLCHRGGDAGRGGAGVEMLR